MITKLCITLILGVAFSTTSNAQVLLDVAAKSYVIMNVSSGELILTKDETNVRSIASITKLLVADQLSNVDLASDLVEVDRSDAVSSRTRLRPNTLITQSDLLRLSLISSDNQAIHALARAQGMSSVINNVNLAAVNRHLYSITIEEPTGLSANNKASALDLANFVKFVNSDNARISTEPTAVVQQGVFRSTNPLIDKPGWKFGLSKTGFTNAAGGCLVSLVEIGGVMRVVVLLGSDNVHTRWSDLVKIRRYLAPSDVFWVPDYRQRVAKRVVKNKRKKIT